MSKRLFDIFSGSLGLIMLAPALLFIAVWIKWDTPGPILFFQKRVGRNGHLFDIFKFRTMHTGCYADAQLTIGRDSRITAAGHILRRYKLDELPQLLNVLHGSMSLVGPRPEVPRYVALYPPHIRALVLSIAPGITDWAAMEFKDESALLARASDPERAYVDQVLPAKLTYYAHYVRERNLGLDIWIILRTLRLLLR